MDIVWAPNPPIKARAAALSALENGFFWQAYCLVLSRVLNRRSSASYKNPHYSFYLVLYSCYIIIFSHSESYFGNLFWHENCYNFDFWSAKCKISEWKQEYFFRLSRQQSWFICKSPNFFPFFLGPFLLPPCSPISLCIQTNSPMMIESIFLFIA